MSETKQTPLFANFGEMSWPMPSERLADVESKLRHCPGEASQCDMMLAASVLAAYRELVLCSSRKRAVVISGIRAATDRQLPCPSHVDDTITSK